MNWTVYLSGEIHTDWRERIIEVSPRAKGPVTAISHRLHDHYHHRAVFAFAAAAASAFVHAALTLTFASASAPALPQLTHPSD